MKKIIRLTESDLINLVNRVIKEQSVVGAPNMGTISKSNTVSNSKFKAQATVEDDMIMEFPVVKFHYDASGVDMFFKEGNVLLNVHNFEGPIFKGLSKKYIDSYFSNIDSKNWKSIAKKYNIPVSEVMV